MDVKEMARMGGVASARSRFKGKTKKQKRDIMRSVRFKKGIK